MTDPITSQRLAELRRHYDNGVDDALEGLLELMATGHDGWLNNPKARATWTQSLKAYQADHVALLAEVERLQDELAGHPEGLYENWAVGYTDLFGEQRHVQYGAEEDARDHLATHPRGAVLQRRWQTDWATVYPALRAGDTKTETRDV